MKDLIFLSQQIWKGKSVLRAFLNLRLSKEQLEGKIVDIGGGVGAGYIEFMPQKKGSEFVTFDQKRGDNINFEMDKLPFDNDTHDTVVFLNVMEHIYNHKHILGEVFRIRKQGGQILGFVPFLMWYHPDPRDFFRYTEDALRNIFDEVLPQKGMGTIEPVGRGPFSAACHMFLLAAPRILRVPIFLVFYSLDGLVLLRNRHATKRYVLGYYFKI